MLTAGAWLKKLPKPFRPKQSEMKRYFVLLATMVLTGIAAAQNEVVVDANAELRTINGSFQSIKVSGGIDLYLSQSTEESVAVSAAEERFKPGIKTVVENGKLRIYYDGEKFLGLRNKQLKVYVAFKMIDKIEASGACDVLVAGTITAEALSLHFSGASDFKGNVKVKELNLDLSGASDLSISGTASTVRIESSGASDVKGYGLTTDLCSANASGASDINITVNKELNVHASGASKISYSGDALIKEMHTSGSSKISKRG